jgi:hypothetical protein
VDRGGRKRWLPQICDKNEKGAEEKYTGRKDKQLII